MTTRILVGAGSGRSGSINARLAKLAARFAREAGAKVTEVDFAALGLPLYHADIEAAGIPDGARELRRLFAENQGWLLAAPEYNAFVTPLVVNTIAWASRVVAEDGLPSGLDAMRGTVVGLMSASPGAFGGARGLIALRTLLSMAPAMLVVPETASIGQAHAAFDDGGALKDAKQQQTVERVVRSVLRTATALNG